MLSTFTDTHVHVQLYNVIKCQIFPLPVDLAVIQFDTVSYDIFSMEYFRNFDINKYETFLFLKIQILFDPMEY